MTRTTRYVCVFLVYFCIFIINAFLFVCVFFLYMLKQMSEVLPTVAGLGQRLSPNGTSQIKVGSQ